MLLDLHNNIKVERSISPTRVTTDTAQVGQIIDTAGAHSLEYVIAIGTLADAAATFTVLVEHGDDSGLSDAAAVPDAFLIGTESGASFTQANDDIVRKIGYIGDKRYNRLTITPAGNAANADFGAVAVTTRAKGPQSTQ